jgi:hypothetical protein
VAKRKRPNLNDAIEALLKDLVARMPEYSHVDPSRVLVVAGEARRASRGTVKPLTFANGKSTDAKGRKKPQVRLRGRKMLYCITLRPLFFRDSTPEDRVGTLLHELFHVSPSFDGTLADDRRHASLGRQFGKRLRPLVRRYLRLCPPELVAPFGYDGEVRVLQWLERPPPLYTPDRTTVRRVYRDEQLFQATVRMLTASGARPATRAKLH